MYLYKRANSKVWQAEIWIDGQQYRRSTGCADKKLAAAVARSEEARLRQQVSAQSAAGISLALDAVQLRYMAAIEQCDAAAENTNRLLALILKHPAFPPTKLITEITHDDAMALRNWRRTHKVGKGKTVRPISAYTVNDTVEQLKKMFTFLKAQKVHLPNEPIWKELWLSEPREHVRELGPNEEELLADMRADYLPLVWFSLMTGKRKTSCFTLTWAQVKWDRGVILMTGKGTGGGKPITLEITPAIRAVLWPLYVGRADNAGAPEAAERVFTFVAERTLDKVIKGHRHVFVAGKRYPITRDGLRRAWNTWRDRHGLRRGSERLRWHDLRHDFASKLLRSIPTADGIKVVQEALDHADISTTLNTYSHLQEGRVADAIEALAQRRSPALVPRTVAPHIRPVKVIKGR